MLCVRNWPFCTQQARIVYADGKPQSVQTMCTIVHVEIGGHQVPTEFVYVPSNPFVETLLGVDFLAAADIDCDPSTRQWCFRDHIHAKFPVLGHFAKLFSPNNISPWTFRQMCFTAITIWTVYNNANRHFPQRYVRQIANRQMYILAYITIPQKHICQIIVKTYF